MRRGVWAFVVGVVFLACGGVEVAPGDSGTWQPQPGVKQQAIDKVDLLLAIDNSPSMGDKQQLLAEAVPVLIDRLLNPRCVDIDTSHTCAQASDCTGYLGAGAQCDARGNGGAGRCFVAGDDLGGDKQCTSIAGTKPEFPPVHDMHVGIVSSSLGSGGLTDPGDPCVVTGNDTTHQDDHGHLVNRTYDSTTGGDGPPIANAKPVDGTGGNFLAWLPSSDPKNATAPAPNVTPYSDATTLVNEFQSLVAGVQQHGCGLEAQLESWYRFLIQPDPWQDLVRTNDNPPRVKLSGVDATLLEMRHDFLRPDSLVAILQLTDEDDSWSDPLWGGDANSGGFGWVVRSQSFPGGPGQGVGPRETSACDGPIDPSAPTHTGPSDPACTSCAFSGSSGDPNCSSCAGGATGCQPGWYTTKQDGLNVRYGEQLMKPRYGLDPQFPIQRYVDGLTSPKVPDSANESHTWPDWTPNRNCVNPLFAENLPDGSDTSEVALCNLTPGPRSPDMVFYALVGGVPSSLVDDASGNLKADLQAADWQKILGKDPDHFDFTGIDPHMIESIAPRNGLPPPGSTYGLGSDPDSGREWNTLTSAAGIDFQYACTFDLPAPKDCTAAANQGACDCAGANGATSAADGPPLCDMANRTTQIKGKAYPTIRELRVAKGLGAQATVASICAKDTNVADEASSSYGYNQAMNAIVDRLAQALSAQGCLTTALARNADGTVGCDMLVVYPTQTDQASGCTDPGMIQPSPDVLSRFDQQYLASIGGAGPVPVLCLYKQLVSGVDYQGASCAGSPAAGWCYVEGAASTGGCAQSIAFGAAGPPPGTTVDLECPQP